MVKAINGQGGALQEVEKKTNIAFMNASTLYFLDQDAIKVKTAVTFDMMTAKVIDKVFWVIRSGGWSELNESIITLECLNNRDGQFTKQTEFCPEKLGIRCLDLGRFQVSWCQGQSLLLLSIECRQTSKKGITCIGPSGCVVCKVMFNDLHENNGHYRRCIMEAKILDLFKMTSYFGCVTNTMLEEVSTLCRCTVVLERSTR